MHVRCPLVHVLSIAKLRVGQEAYHLSGVAQSLDAYYTGNGETAGAWIGGGAQRLGLSGDVNADDLRAVLAGLAPGRGGLSPNGQPPRSHARRVPDFDLTFKAPKSASVLYAVSDDPRVQGAVIEAGEVAMRAAVGWLEREAVRVQRGSHNLVWLAAHPDARGPHRLATSGVVAASFRHRTSRAADPLLHWHVLVANLVEGADGRWSAFAHPDVYRHARAAGEVFQTVYRQELTRTLGVEWRPGRHVPEIAGIPQTLLDQFSKRTTEIDAWLAATGTPDTPEGRQTAVLATRRHKPEVEGGRFDEGWKLEAEAAGWGPDAAERLIGFSMNRAGMHLDDDLDGVWRLEAVRFDEDGTAEFYDRTVEPEEWIAHLLRTRLTNDRSTFTETDLVQAVAASQGAGATVETIERIADRVLASDHVLAIVNRVGNPRTWTSRELHDIEARFVTAITTMTIPRLDTVAMAGVLERFETLGVDQRAAVEAICTSTAAVSVLIGPAGTGKTFTLDAVRSVFEDAGLRVIGVAPSARAALELSSGANLTTSTIHALLERWDRGLDDPIPGSLLVVDEAGMADIRILERLVTRQLGTGGRVLLVGDHHQLPEVGAGGGFAYAAVHSPCVAELIVNRRQRETWEQEALQAIRSGTVATAVRAYLDHDRVVVADSPAAMIAAAVDKWFETRAAGLRPVILAGTNDLVDRLNAAVINRLVAVGELDDSTPRSYGTGAFRVGERVVLRRNSIEHTTTGGEIDVANGQTGLITHIADGRLSILLDRDATEIVLSDRYLKRGGQVTHAYALTTHRAQGGTWDLGIAVGTDGLYREGAYVELSRGRAENWIILTSPEAADIYHQTSSDIIRHDHGITPTEDLPPTVETDLVERISRSRANAEQHIAPHTPGLGPTPTDTHTAHAWTHLQQHLGATRVWLTSTDRIEPIWTVTPSYHELLTRRSQLDTILDTAPPDHSRVIEQLRHGQLSFDDTTELLQTATTAQGDRRAWIIEHWPDIVEYQEIARTITTETWGPNPRLLDELLDHNITHQLAAAIRNDEPWLRPALCRATIDDTTHIGTDAITWLEQIADYRNTTRITTIEPLGPRPIGTDTSERQLDTWTSLREFQPSTDIGLDQYDYDIEM